jgi:hypothetical protein
MAMTDARWVLRLAALVNVAGVVAAFRIPRAARTARPVAAAEARELRAASILLAATAMTVLRSVVGFLTFLVAFALKRSGQPAWFYGLVVGAGALGGLLGAVVAPRLRRRIREEAILAGSLLVPVLVGLVGARVYGRPALLAVPTVVALGAAAGRLAFDSLVQRDAPDAVRGRTFARFETRFQIAWVAGALVPVAFPIPGRWGFLAMSLGLAFAGASYLAGVRAARAGVRTT